MLTKTIMIDSSSAKSQRLIEMHSYYSKVLFKREYKNNASSRRSSYNNSTTNTSTTNNGTNYKTKTKDESIDNNVNVVMNRQSHEKKFNLNNKSLNDKDEEPQNVSSSTSSAMHNNYSNNVVRTLEGFPDESQEPTGEHQQQQQQETFTSVVDTININRNNNESNINNNNNNNNFWMKFICFTISFNLFYILSFSCKFRVRVPNSNDFWRLTNFCNYTMSNTVGLVSHSSYALLLKVESTLVRRTARFRRNNCSNFATSKAENSLPPNNGIFTQYKRNFWTRSKHRQQQQQQQEASKFGSSNKLVRYFSSLKWSPIPVSVGVGFLAFNQYKKVLRRTGDEASGDGKTPVSITTEWEIICYRMLPWKTLSKMWGWVNNVNLPMFAREPILNLYARTFNCDIDEAEVTDLKNYSNLGEFFRRGLKTGVRPLDPYSLIVSPCDGRILHFGKVECGRIEQIKGVTYSLPAFLGPMSWNTNHKPHAKRDSNQEENKNSLIKFPETTTTKDMNSDAYCSMLLKQKQGTSLFYCVLYLAPGDYHRFHSPVEWHVKFRRHVGGELLSVNPSIASWIAGLLSLNERANYIGEWKHGFFSMTAVGATNVGSIRVYRDKALQTNSFRVKKNTYADKYFDQKLHYKKGDSFGEFNLGSTIVILFEAPSEYDFTLAKQNSHVKVGEALLHIH